MMTRQYPAPRIGAKPIGCPTSPLTELVAARQPGGRLRQIRPKTSAIPTDRQVPHRDIAARRRGQGELEAARPTTRSTG